MEMFDIGGVRYDSCAGSTWIAAKLMESTSSGSWDLSSCHRNFQSPYYYSSISVIEFSGLDILAYQILRPESLVSMSWHLSFCGRNLQFQRLGPSAFTIAVRDRTQKGYSEDSDT
jgi:hypothetical protein